MHLHIHTYTYLQYGVYINCLLGINPIIAVFEVNELGITLKTILIIKILLYSRHNTHSLTGILDKCYNFCSIQYLF